MSKPDADGLPLNSSLQSRPGLTGDGGGLGGIMGGGGEEFRGGGGDAREGGGGLAVGGGGNLRVCGGGLLTGGGGGLLAGGGGLYRKGDYPLLCLSHICYILCISDSYASGAEELHA